MRHWKKVRGNDPDPTTGHYLPRNVRVTIVEKFPEQDVVECYRSMSLSESEFERAVERLRRVFEEGMQGSEGPIMMDK
jgi:hypothetical protein